MDNTPVTGVLLDIHSGMAGRYTVDGSLQGYYTALRCNCITIAKRYIGGEIFSIYCDDEGLLKANYQISAVDGERHPALVGNLFIAQVDEEGNTVSLTGSQIRKALDHIRIACYNDHSGMHINPILWMD